MTAHAVRNPLCYRRAIGIHHLTAAITSGHARQSLLEIGAPVKPERDIFDAERRPDVLLHVRF